MKALTFLDIGQYESISYVWSGSEPSRPTSLFPVAIDEISRPEKVIVFVTPQAKKHLHFSDLCQQLGNRLQAVDIPEGKTEAELWDIFDRVASAVSENDTILLDITHAFRFLPMIVFAAAAYLRRTKGVPVKHIVYGTFEARKPLQTPPQPED